MPYPGVYLRAGAEMKIEPDEIAVALIKRGFFREAPGDPLAFPRPAKPPDPIKKEKKEKKEKKGTE